MEKDVINFLNWRNNMWVMTPDGIGIIFQLGVTCEIHLVDPISGLTIDHKWYDIYQLRQAKYKEIPECRRGLSKEQFAKMGYV